MVGLGPELVEKLDALIKAGQRGEAHSILSEIEIRKVPRLITAALASIARRLEHFTLALRLLNPIVRAANPLIEPATVAEELEYGIVLMKIGALDESRRILQKIDAESKPDALLFLAMSFFSEWDYSAAIPLLRRYINSSAITPYQRMVGRVNLAASLIHEGFHSEANEVLTTLRAETTEAGARLLYGNCLELSAQLAIQMKDHAKASQRLEEALTLIGGTKSVSELYIRKWIAVSASYKAGKIAKALHEIRHEALDRHQWEVVRDCDFHAGVITRAPEQLLRCYVGTPFQSYRKGLLQNAGIQLEIPKYYFHSSNEKSASSVVLDLELGAASSGGEALPAGSHLHKFLILLLRDFYRPLDIVTAFSAISPDEYYNPESSPARIHQLAKRLREWIDSNQLPLRLETVDSRYRLALGESIAVCVPREPLPLDANELQLLKLQRSLHEIQFTAKEARVALDVSFGSANGLIKWATERGHVEKLGTGSATRYRFLTL